MNTGPISHAPNHDGFAPRHHAGAEGRCAYSLWGEIGEDFDKPSFDQLHAACGLPVAAAAALMPDAHVGYGLPIGGVLATRNAVVLDEDLATYVASVKTHSGIMVARPLEPS